MDNYIETHEQPLDVISQLLRESGLEVTNLKREWTVQVVGGYSNDVHEYTGLTPDGIPIAFFVKAFPERPMEIAIAKVEKEVRSTQKLADVSPLPCYRIISYSKKFPMIATETLSDSQPLTYFLKGQPTRGEAEMFKGALHLIHFLHQRGIIHGDALARNFSLLSMRLLLNPQDKFHGIVALDFEKAQFHEDLELQTADQQFLELELADIFRFVTSIYPIIENDTERQSLFQYYQIQRSAIRDAIVVLYGQQFNARFEQMLDQWLYDVMNPS
jgi:tRNA A-37 threonylcarbamoyl transferase component Bud32